MTKGEVCKVAAQVSDVSLDYHFTHAAFAGNKMLEDNFKERHHKEVSLIKKELKVACQKNDTAEIDRLIEREKYLRPPKHRIFVDYIKFDKAYSLRAVARVVKAKDRFIITLPKSLIDGTRGADGSYKPDPGNVQTLRRLMAHELGHIILHTDRLLSIDGIEGTREIVEKELEREADWFAEELMRLRLERNKVLAPTGTNP